MDVTDSTELASRLDPERFREVLAAFHSMVDGEISWLRGRAEGFIGDAVLGVFGVPTAHDDDAVRAIRAALAIVEHAPRLGRELALPTPLRVRVGVNTGGVAVGTPSDRSLVIGAEVNLGARLQQAAEPGEVLVGATTRQLARDAVEFGEMRSFRAKGLEDEVQGWPVTGLAPRSARSTIPFVDRRRELALLSDTFERVKERGRAHLVTLLGEPGIGKSRVVAEFVDALNGVKVLTGRSSPFEEEATFWPLAEMLYREIGRAPDSPHAAVTARLREVAHAWCGDDEPERTAQRLGLVLGMGEQATDENRYHAAEVRIGTIAMVEGIAARGPLVMVFEDMEESDPLLLDLIEQLLRDARRLPLLVICVARWEFLAERPGWAGGLADAVTLWVEPLATKDAVQLAIEAGDLELQDARRVAAHAGGNPFFIIEITGMLLREDRALPPTGLAPSARLLPATVQATIAARMDALTPSARDLVRKASIFARGVFDLSELELIVDPNKSALTELEDHEFLVRDEDRPTLWRFRSDVLRDVAYESLAKRERQRLHLRLANCLSEPDTVDRYPRSIAYHLEQAARASLDLNPRDRALAERAVGALANAGDLARRRFESGSASDLYERALALAGPEDGWGEREALILAAMGEAHYWLGNFDAAEAVLERALEIAGETSDPVRALAARFLADSIGADDDERAGALFDEALAAARRLGDPTAVSRTLLMAGWVPYRTDDLGTSRKMFGEALELARAGERSDRWAEARARVALASIESQDGDERDALALAEEALEIGRASGQAFTTATAEEMVARSLRRMLRLDEALAHAGEAIRIYREVGARWELASVLGDRGAVHRLAGRPDDAEADLREALALCRDLAERQLLTWTASELARTQVLSDDVAGARQTLEDPNVRVAIDRPGARTALLVGEAVIALAEGDRDGARARSIEAIDSVAPVGALRNPRAAQIWWAARLFGSDAVGGDAVAAEARALLEAHAWKQALLEPDLAPGQAVQA